MKRTLTAAFLALSLISTLFLVPAHAAPKAISVTLNGTPVPYNQNYGYPFLDAAGRTQVPFRLTLEQFGCTVSWEDSTRTAIAQKDSTTVKVPLDQYYILVNGTKVKTDTCAVLVGSRTYLPIRAVLEAFGATVRWDDVNRCVVVTDGDQPPVKVHFIDVGQGDAALIDCGTVEVLIDGGNNKYGAKVSSYLAPYVDGKLDYIIATHPHADHVGGLDTVLKAYAVGEVIDSGYKATSATYKDYLAAAKNEPSCTFSYDENRILSLNANTKLSVIETGDSWTESNDSSVVCQLICGNTSVLFTGDMSQEVEKKTLSLFGDIDVLKVGHHGSATSSCSAFLDVIQPEAAVCSYGIGNTYHHPTSSALARLFQRGIAVYGTGKSGDIVLTIDGQGYRFNTTDALTYADAG